jgi:hypothetical protein
LNNLLLIWNGTVYAPLIEADYSKESTKKETFLELTLHSLHNQFCGYHNFWFIRFYVILGIIGFSYGIVLLSEKPITPSNELKRG